ncbi:BTAD domain-containing putative transcriptional regulator [Nonomuraea lactucae]|uniref:BTAD domain-containing putative transcriptional regulator n=1 Tax=Nonomuraea lactucae TaxID=2249762 RepID=UPI000DE2B8A2|nr:BTAD domain-containing putative transcriptional regulator [Nonomuraea lactucae]
MRFGVLGPLAVWTEAGESVTIPGLKVRALLADLLLHEGRVVSADRLVDDLWNAEPPGNPAGALHVRVSQLRRALEEAEPGGRHLVVSRAPGYLLHAGAGAVDAVRFGELVARAETAQSPRARAALLSEALGLWRGPALADLADEEFARTAIVRLEEQRLATLEHHAETRLELGEHGLLAAELGDLVARHPLRERLRAAHMLALYRAGRQSEALAGYADIRERLADELGLDPGPELAELHQAILGQDAALNPAPVVPERLRTNLPASLSELIGRDGELAEVRALLEDGRLVTLTGSGGVGKTRLALEAAAQLAGTAPGAYADGVWLVELASLDRDTGSVAEAVMAALDIREGAEPTAPAERLAEALRAGRSLLVLDNCEHVVEQAAELVERLLRAAPGLRVLATSREPLAVPGEVLWTVPPLDLPGGTDLDAVERSDAVRLFVTRAAASTRGFTLDAGNAGAVAQLCRRLDGIPLALELAATRVRALGVQGVVARLDDRFRLLAAGPRGVPARQRTLTAVIDWSWDLLTEPERVVLRRLAVHADGCTLESAEAVCSTEAVEQPDIGRVLAPEGPEGADVLDLLARLVDRSLVVALEGAAGVRYRLLESVAAYCLDRLSDAGELEPVRRAHARHYLALAVQAEPALYGPEQGEWLARLDAEAANLRAALDTAVREGDAAIALRLVNALAWYWFLRGRPAEARRSLDAALAVDGQVPGQAPGQAPRQIPEQAPGRARAAAWRAGFALVLGDDAGWDTSTLEDPGERARAELFLGMAVSDVPVAQELVSGALATFRSIGDEWGVAAALSMRARDHFTQRDLVALERDAEESTRIFRRLGDRWGQLQATQWLAGLAEIASDVERATRLFEDGLRLAEELGLWPEAARRTAWLGWMALQSGRYERAMELCGSALRLATGQGFREGQVMAEMGLAFAARRAGRFELAETHILHLLDGVPRHPGAEPPLHLPSTLIELGHLRERRGDPAAAVNLQLEALVAAQKIGDPRTAAAAVEGLAAALTSPDLPPGDTSAGPAGAELASAGVELPSAEARVVPAGSHERAARLLGLAAGVRQANQTPAGPSEQAEIDRASAYAREALGEEAFAAAHERGRRLKLDDAADLA